MKIQTIRYERLHTFGSYENERFSVEVVVDEGEDPHLAADTLRLFVENEIAESDRHREEEEARRQAEWRRRYDEQRSQFETAGCVTEDEDSDPFPGLTEEIDNEQP